MAIDSLRFSRKALILIDKLFLCLIKMSGNFISSFFNDCQIVSPLPYAIGNQAEEIKFNMLLCAINEKKPVILFPAHNLQKLLGYRQCNLALSNACKDYSKSMIGNTKYNTVWIIFNTIFIIQRVTYLIFGADLVRNINTLSKSNVSGLAYFWSFPRAGIDNVWKELINHTVDEINIQRLSFLQGMLNTSVEKVFKESAISKKSHFNDLLSGDLIIIHTRSGIYHDDGNRRNRNSDIENFIPGLGSLCRNTGMKAIIIGDHNSLDFSINDLIINLPNLVKDEGLRRELELEAIRKCCLYIGTQSGPMDLANLMSKPIILFNCIDLTTTSSAFWSESISFSKPPRLYTDIDKWIGNYFFDLNSDCQGEDFEFQNSSHFIKEILNEFSSSISRLKSSPISYYNDNRHFAIKQVSCISKLSFMVPEKKLNFMICKLIRHWEQQAKISPFESISSYLLEEVSRLRNKNKFSNPNKGYTFIDYAKTKGMP